MCTKDESHVGLAYQVSCSISPDIVMMNGWIADLTVTIPFLDDCEHFTLLTNRKEISANGRSKFTKLVRQLRTVDSFRSSITVVRMGEVGDIRDHITVTGGRVSLGKRVFPVAFTKRLADAIGDALDTPHPLTISASGFGCISVSPVYDVTVLTCNGGPSVTQEVQNGHVLCKPPFEYILICDNYYGREHDLNGVIYEGECSTGFYKFKIK